ncbi:MAG: acyl carrier protein [Cyanobacteria bacterium P01_F01_bin.86]
MTNSTDTAKAQIKDYLCQFLDGEVIGYDQDISDFGFTSMFSMQLVLFLEKEFQVILETEDLEANALRTVNSIADLVERKRVATS